MAKWILPEADSVGLKGERLIVLDLAFPEVTNAIWNVSFAISSHSTKELLVDRSDDQID